MKTRQTILCGFLAVLTALAFTACDNGSGPGNNPNNNNGTNSGTEGNGNGNGGSGTTVPGSTLSAKLTWLSTNAANNTAYTIEVNANESIVPQTLSYANKSGITIILKGTGAERTISLSENGSLFTVGSGVKLVLDNNITIRGRSDNNDPLVYVNSGGTLEMKANAKISGNTTRFSGGGVIVYDGGIFTMSGGEISGNTSSGRGGGVGVGLGTFTMTGGEISGNTATAYGGGVYSGAGTFTMNGGKISGNTSSNSSNNGEGGGVDSSGTFTMNDGEISGNTADFGGGVSGILTMNGGKISGNTAGSGGGGGVYIIFRMVNGTIYGSNEADESLRNTTSGSGAALYKGLVGSTAERGTFSGETWISKGNLSSTSNTNNTIRVVNGELQ